MNDVQAKELLRLKAQIAQAGSVKAFNSIATEALKWAVKNLPNDGINKQGLINLISESRKRILNKRRK
jgi:hypothetical protein